MPRKSFGDHDVQSLWAVAERIRLCAGRLDAIRKAMELEGADVLSISGDAELRRGMAGIERFTHQALIALQLWRESQGIFSAGYEPEPPTGGNSEGGGGPRSKNNPRKKRAARKR